MRIAIAGTRGIPAHYGGFETFAEELSVRLAERGHTVVVYGRKPFFTIYSGVTNYRGAAIRVTSTIMHKYLETPLHSLTTFLDLFLRPVDVILLCNAANSPFSWIGRLRGMPLATNVDGIERLRGKWNSLGRLWYRLGEMSAVLFSNRIIADAEMIKRYYLETYQTDSQVIAYGANVVRREAGKTLAQFGLTTGQYVLYVSRLEPENNALGVVEAYCRSPAKIPLVIVGDAPYAQGYIARVKAAADSRVIFTGFQFGEAYQELRSNALVAVQATEVGGTHPALVEAMAYGNCVIANRVPEHEEVLGDAGLYYDKNNFEQLAELFTKVLSDSELIVKFGQQAQTRAQQHYNWETVTDQYELLFKEMLAGSK
jgi:glycosyltransferase involved in cell wall biosynthesis